MSRLKLKLHTWFDNKRFDYKGLWSTGTGELIKSRSGLEPFRVYFGFSTIKHRSHKSCIQSNLLRTARNYLNSITKETVVHKNKASNNVSSWFFMY